MWIFCFAFILHYNAGAQTSILLQFVNSDRSDCLETLSVLNIAEVAFCEAKSINIDNIIKKFIHRHHVVIFATNHQIEGLPLRQLNRQPRNLHHQN